MQSDRYGGDGPAFRAARQSARRDHQRHRRTSRRSIRCLAGRRNRTAHGRRHRHRAHGPHGRFRPLQLLPIETWRLHGGSRRARIRAAAQAVDRRRRGSDPNRRFRSAGGRRRGPEHRRHHGSAADQYRECQHRYHAGRGGHRESSESRLRSHLSGAVRSRRADQYGGQQQRLRRRTERLRQRAVQRSARAIQRLHRRWPGNQRSADQSQQRIGDQPCAGLELHFRSHRQHHFVRGRPGPLRRFPDHIRD